MGSPRQEAIDFSGDGLGLGENCGLEAGVVANPGVEGGDAADGGVETVEQLIRDAGRDLSAVAPGERVLVGDDDTAGLLDGGADGLPIIGSEGAEVEDLDTGVGIAA